MITVYRHTKASYADVTTIEVDDAPCALPRMVMVRYNGTGHRATNAWRSMHHADVLYCIRKRRWVRTEPWLTLTEGL